MGRVLQCNFVITEAAGASSAQCGATLIPSMLQKGIDRPLDAGWICETRQGRWLLPIQGISLRNYRL